MKEQYQREDKVAFICTVCSLESKTQVTLAPQIPAHVTLLEVFLHLKKKKQPQHCNSLIGK